MSPAPVAEPTEGFSRLEELAVMVALGVAVLLVAAPPPARFVSLAVVPATLAMFAWIAMSDWRRFIIPDGPVIAVALLGAALRLGEAGASSLDLLIVVGDGLLWGVLFLSIREIYFRRRGFDGLGFGDVKLAFASAVLLGVAGFAWALLLASLSGLAAAFAARHRGRRLDRIPFGAFLAPACGLIWLAGLGG